MAGVDLRRGDMINSYPVERANTIGSLRRAEDSVALRAVGAVLACLTLPLDRSTSEHRPLRPKASSTTSS